MSSAEKLYVTDGRSGNKYEVPINLNAVLASDLANIHDPCSQTPRSLRIVDESLRHTAIGYSHITLLDAEKGRLYYRDHDITSIFGKKTYEQSCFCLIWGRWPSSAEAVAFRQDLAASVEHFPQLVLDIIRKLPRDAPSVTMFQTGLSAMLAVQASTIPAFTGKNAYLKDMHTVDASIVRTLRTAQVLFAAVYCHRQGKELAELDPDQPFAYNLLLMMGFVDGKTQRPGPKHVRWLEKILLVYADHEMSCATFAFLTAASAHSDPLSCYLTGLTTLYGAIHGGAIDAAYLMLQRVGNLNQVADLMAAVKRREEVLFGFGHRVYIARDPRAQLLLDLLHEIQADEKTVDPLFAIAEEIDRLASKDPFFQERGVRINADLYMNFACTAMWVSPALV